MRAPLGFADDYGPWKGCRLRKALYGLKQSLRAWFGRFTTTMKKFGCKQSNSDYTLFLKRERKPDYLSHYIRWWHGHHWKRRTRDWWTQEKTVSKIWDEGPRKLKVLSSIEVLRSKKEIFINQKKYILDLLNEIGMVDCKPAKNLIIVHHGLRT